jgi:hypothetical protein
MSHIAGILQVKLFGQSYGRGGRGDSLPAVSAGALLALLLIAFCMEGCVSEPERQPGAGVSPSADVPIDQAWHDAKAVAARGVGRMPAVGTGSSMQPIYGDNTLLVINPIAYDDLRPGMTVAYCNRQGVRVVHRLVVKLADGWRIEGLNNDRPDYDVVTRQNLVGVVYATFNYDSDEQTKPPGQKPTQPTATARPGS